MGHPRNWHTDLPKPTETCHTIFIPKGNDPMNKINTRYQNQIKADRRAAALQRAEERRMMGRTTEETINTLYV